MSLEPERQQQPTATKSSDPCGDFLREYAAACQRLNVQMKPWSGSDDTKPFRNSDPNKEHRTHGGTL